MMMNEHGISLAHTTILQWVQRYIPELEQRLRKTDRQIGHSWNVDETYVRFRGYGPIYIDQSISIGNTVDFS